MAAEHAALSDQLATSFDPKIAKRMGVLGQVAKALAEWNDANKVRYQLPKTN
jgi:peptide chain release factor 1